MKDQRYDDMMPRCIVGFLNLTAMEKEMRSDNDTTLVGMDTPYCDPDGSYAPKQCKDDRCYCVRPDGRPYDNQDTVPRYSVEEQEMTCNCLREKELLSSAEVPMTMLIRTFLRHRCARNGNYLPLQCTTFSSCRCVDKDGFQNSPDVMVSERHSLPCYKREYDRYFREEIEEFE
ncbi:thyroglobulin-like [Ornithodoros turicata]|uniref:thyroglobulin-like n=1 Tax=Ornithodoros turicata TaxID=34597 RepID=UPI00313A4402